MVRASPLPTNGRPCRTGPAPSAPFETSGFLTPDNPDFWNPLVSRNRLTSPFGNNTRIVCTAFHGVLMDCWQADRDGNPHKLVKLPLNFPSVTGSSLPGGGPGHYVYPGFVPRHLRERQGCGSWWMRSSGTPAARRCDTVVRTIDGDPQICTS